MEAQLSRVLARMLTQQQHAARPERVGHRPHRRRELLWRDGREHEQAGDQVRLDAVIPTNPRPQRRLRRREVVHEGGDATGIVGGMRLDELDGLGREVAGEDAEVPMALDERPDGVAGAAADLEQRHWRRAIAQLRLRQRVNILELAREPVPVEEELVAVLPVEALPVLGRIALAFVDDERRGDTAVRGSAGFSNLAKTNGDDLAMRGQ